MIPQTQQSLQWVVAWDKATGGFRATAGDLQTGSYLSPSIALQAARHIETAVALQAEQAERQAERAEREEGLVPCQQSLNGHPFGMLQSPPIGGDEEAAQKEPVIAPPGGRSASAGASEQDEKYQQGCAFSWHFDQVSRAYHEERVRIEHEMESTPKVRLKGRRWNITLSNGEDEHQVDSQISRLVRCQRRVKAWSDAIPRLNRRLRRLYKKKNIGPRMVMVTLTYEDIDAWEPNQIRQFMQDVRKLLKDKLWAYAWVLEMQERGAAHYHVLLYVAPGTDVPEPDKAGLWQYGCTRRETAEKGPKYILTYVGKEHQKEGLPLGARMFAVWIGKKQATAEELFGFRLSSAPPYLQKKILEYYEEGIINANVRWERVFGGGWLIKDIGEILQSEWYLVRISEYIE
ncbi:rolling circle replication-associated protein [Candidatus Chloroploca asiatica]|uniref:Replication-associated protein ORF2/G2P domain-containing protein n=1 Tax=Candidatus Chloroploca asiatica TaxID=1506545 RepID=A0A2H3KZ93_9CHLR|nr:hypothetical protein [Candidatus Chloroploca asiatica]PDW00977.1 hypothetical protein A9Q02_21345 [Candidatus Chloroploca asiatica]